MKPQQISAIAEEIEQRLGVNRNAVMMIITSQLTKHLADEEKPTLWHGGKASASPAQISKLVNEIDARQPVAESEHPTPDKSLDDAIAERINPELHAWFPQIKQIALNCTASLRRNLATCIETKDRLAEQRDALEEQNEQLRKELVDAQDYISTLTDKSIELNNQLRADLTAERKVSDYLAEKIKSGGYDDKVLALSARAALRKTNL